jgi:hypothetical protein
VGPEARAEISELDKVLQEETVEVLRDRFPGQRRHIRQPLVQWGNYTWLFPFGVQPDLREPVEVYRNGISQWMGQECEVLVVGKPRWVAVAVFHSPSREGDVVQATYDTLPEGQKG